MNSQMRFRIVTLLLLAIGIAASGEIKNVVYLFSEGNYAAAVPHIAVAALFPICLVYAGFFTTAVLLTVGGLFVHGVFVTLVSAHVGIHAIGLAMRNLSGDFEHAQEIMAHSLRFYTGWGSSPLWYAGIGCIVLAVAFRTIRAGKRDIEY